MHGRIKLSEAAANRRAAWTVAVGNRQEAWTGAAAEVAAIALATEVYRRAPVPVPGAAALAELRAAQAEAARGRVVHAALPVWVAPAAAAGGGGNQSMNKEQHMKSQPANICGLKTLRALLLAALGCTVVMFSQAQQSEKQATTPSQPTQKAFATPKEAVEALIQATENFDAPALKEILGPDGEDLVSSEDPVQDKNNAIAFAARAREKNDVAIDPKNSKRAIISVGSEDWPLPIPLVNKAGKWIFDTKVGLQEVLFRRIGSNELDAIQICRGYVEAQHEYALEKHDNAEVNQYAQRIISAPGKHDGLAWRNPDGSMGGPVGEGIAKALDQGYTNKSRAYHGYYFKILKGQGPAARLGQIDFVVNGAMIGGFALAAAPAEYRVTGVKTFLVSYDGVVYQKDLGPETLKIFKDMELYNPDKTWVRTDDNW